MAAARRQRSNPTAFIEDSSVFRDVAQCRRFVKDYTDALECIRLKGVRVALQELAAT